MLLIVVAKHNRAEMLNSNKFVSDCIYACYMHQEGALTCRCESSAALAIRYIVRLGSLINGRKDLRLLRDSGWPWKPTRG